MRHTDPQLGFGLLISGDVRSGETKPQQQTDGHRIFFDDCIFDDPYSLGEREVTCLRKIQFRFCKRSVSMGDIDAPETEENDADLQHRYVSYFRLFSH